MGMIRAIRRFDLDTAAVMPYFLDTIDAGKRLSTQLLIDINFSKGEFFTLLPSDTELEKVSKFNCGGVIKPIVDQSVKVSVKGMSGTFKPKCVRTIDSEVSSFMHDYIHARENGYGIVENYLLEPGNPHVNIENVSVVTHEKEVYYCLTPKNSGSDIYNAIRKSNETWHSLSVLARLDFEPSNSMSLEQIKHVCMGAQYVLTTAYDAEGYIFWERNE